MAHLEELEEVHKPKCGFELEVCDEPQGIEHNGKRSSVGRLVVHQEPGRHTKHNSYTGKMTGRVYSGITGLCANRFDVWKSTTGYFFK